MSQALQDFGGALLVVSSSYFPLTSAGGGRSSRHGPDTRGNGTWAGPRALALLPPGRAAALRPALLGGILLVALNTLTEFGAFPLLRCALSPPNSPSTTQAKMDQGRLVRRGAHCAVPALSGRRSLGAPRQRPLRARRRDTARRGAGRAGLAPVSGLSGSAVLVLFTLGVPLGMILYWLMQRPSAATRASEPACRPWRAPPRLHCGSPSADCAHDDWRCRFVSSQRARRWLIAMLERPAYLAQGLPGIVVALSSSR